MYIKRPFSFKYRYTFRSSMYTQNIYNPATGFNICFLACGDLCSVLALTVYARAVDAKGGNAGQQRSASMDYDDLVRTVRASCVKATHASTCLCTSCISSGARVRPQCGRLWLVIHSLGEKQCRAPLQSVGEHND